jgi:hypothetical protein
MHHLANQTGSRFCSRSAALIGHEQSIHRENSSPSQYDELYRTRCINQHPIRCGAKLLTKVASSTVTEDVSFQVGWLEELQLAAVKALGSDAEKIFVLVEVANELVVGVSYSTGV